MKEASGDPATRDAILATAFELFSTTNYQKLNMRTIAERAGVSKALLFYYFKSKEDLARQSLVKGLEMEMELFGPIDEITPDKLPEVLPFFLEESLKRIYIVQAFVEVVDLEDPEDPLGKLLRNLYNQIIDLFESFLRERGVRYPREKAVLLTLSADVFGMTRLLDIEPRGPESYSKAILDILGMGAGD